MGAPVVHFEVIGRDFETLRRFYGELFDWELDKPGSADYALLPLPKKGVGIGGGIGAASEPYGVTFYVQVPDLEAALARVEELGGRTLTGPTDVGPVTMAQFEDPEGHRIGLVGG
jgi:uncharacterized protein